ncbi:MAG: chorismate mutase, partial [Legionellaceae bacterium]
MMQENNAALKIQRFFGSYRLRKQEITKQAIASSAHATLLQAFDLRFQCMKAVAAAKFPINKPIEDAAQVERVITSIRKLAEDKGITNLDAIERLFYQTIVLAERIQTPYYHIIWRNSYQTGV